MRFVIELTSDLPDHLTAEAKTAAVRAATAAADEQLRAAGGRVDTWGLRGSGLSLDAASLLSPADEDAMLATPGVRAALDRALAGSTEDLVSRGSFAGHAEG